MSRSKKVQVIPRALLGIAPAASRETRIPTKTAVNFRTLFINHPEPMWVYNLKTLHCLEVNEAAVEHYGYSRAEFLRTLLTDIHPPEDVPHLFEDIARARAGVQHSAEWRHLHRDGRLIDVEVICHGVAFGGPEAQMLLVHDITKQRQAEHALRQPEQKYRRKLLQAQQKYHDIVENAVIGIFQSTPEGRYITVNPALAAMLGYDSPEDLMASITDFTQEVYVDPKSRVEFKRLAKEQGKATKFESQAYRKDGSKVWLCANVWAISKDGVVVGYEGMNEDVTQRRLLEDELRQSQKMEAVGQFASGIAHDFNNALSIVLGYADLLRMKVPSGDLTHKYVEQIATAGRRASALTRQLLAFSRKQVIQPVVLDLNASTSEFEKMMRRFIGEDIKITFKRGPDLGWVRMDPGQVEQILMNLAMNARDAMPQGGSLRFETANVEVDETYARQDVNVTPGSYVILSVSDTGCGMDRETQLHIFEPFFTTKEAGKGTGLGLSTVYGIVKQNAGHISAHSVPGEGTTFRLYLPRLGKAAKLSEPPQALETIPFGTETVLIVEDEEPLRMLARICLECNGYSVLDAPNAAAALELAKKHGSPIHLLLTDVVMPGMSGRELAECLTAQREVRVLYMSGYNNDLIDHCGNLDHDTVLLEKPFTLHALLTKVYKVLHSHQNGEAATS
jgi:two-component system cell cycle sensor histidine kinase/response regulator CckA